MFDNHGEITINSIVTIILVILGVVIIGGFIIWLFWGNLMPSVQDYVNGI